VGVKVAVFVALLVGVYVGVLVAVLVAVGVAVKVAVAVGLLVGMAVTVEVGVKVKSPEMVWMPVLVMGEDGTGPEVWKVTPLVETTIWKVWPMEAEVERSAVTKRASLLKTSRAT